jgi:hypothetical protein
MVTLPLHGKVHPATGKTFERVGLQSEAGTSRARGQAAAGSGAAEPQPAD